MVFLSHQKHNSKRATEVAVIPSYISLDPIADLFRKKLYNWKRVQTKMTITYTL